MKKKISAYWKAVIIILAAAVLLDLAAFSRKFCDLYIKYVYPHISDILGKITAPIPFALGEVLAGAGIVVTVLIPIILLLLIFLRKKPGYRRFTAAYMKTYLYIIVSVFMSYTLNWIIPFRSSLLDGWEHTGKKYTSEQVLIIRNTYAEKLNALADMQQRDENGAIVPMDREEVMEKVGAAMNSISGEFPRLKGHYPPMKEAAISEILEYMWIGGYTYPYTMELTCNKYTDRFYFPVLYAHESSHHRGYYQENEANFLSYVGCAASDDPFIAMAGCYRIFDKMDNEYWNFLMNNYDEDVAVAIYEQQPQVDPRIFEDRYAALDEAQEKFDEDDHPLEEYSQAAEDAAEKGWETQAKVLKENNYDGDMLLLLEYFDGRLY
ncbi:MAG: DUF3810 family protein [Ruminococcus sp.]|nr:DUF3810 family protein [Ruminococcus sp.]